MPIRSTISPAEIGFQVVLHLLVFTFYAFDRTSPRIEGYEPVYFLQYAAATTLISYWLLPRYFYRHAYLRFTLGLVVVLAAVIVSEELLLEPLFFPKERAARFGGLLFSLSQILPPMTILAAGKFAWDAARGQREVQELRTLVRESELEYLRSQINPHFLFNNLNNLYAYAIEQSPKTPQIILELSAVLRYMLYECRERFVPLEKEITQLRNYTQLNELQVEERGDISFSTAPVPPGFRVAPLILLTFIENAFKHGQAGQVADIHIAIEVSVTEDGNLDFRCANSYSAAPADPGLDRGIGLANVRKRLRLLYPDRHYLDIRDHGDRYEVHLRLQLEITPS